MRKKKGSRTPYTPRARQLVLKKLHELHLMGYDVNEIIDTSTLNGWSGIFQPKTPPQKPVASTVPAVQTSANALEALKQHEQAMSDPEVRARADQARREAMSRIKLVRQA